MINPVAIRLSPPEIYPSVFLRSDVYLSGGVPLHKYFYS